MDRHRKLVSESSLFWCDPKWCHKGREINLRFVTITKANLECSIIYKMAVSLDTNTRPQEKQSKEGQDGHVLVFPRRVKNASNQGRNCCIFEQMSNKDEELTTSKVSWCRSKEWRWIRTTLQWWLVVISMSLFALLTIRVTDLQPWMVLHWGGQNLMELHLHWFTVWFFHLQTLVNINKHLFLELSGCSNSTNLYSHGWMLHLNKFML